MNEIISKESQEELLGIGDQKPLLNCILRNKIEEQYDCSPRSMGPTSLSGTLMDIPRQCGCGRNRATATLIANRRSYTNGTHPHTAAITGSLGLGYIGLKRQ